MRKFRGDRRNREFGQDPEIEGRKVPIGEGYRNNDIYIQNEKTKRPRILIS